MAQVSDFIYFRLLKSATTVAYLGLIVLTWRFFEHEHYWKIGIGAAALSAFWLIVTRLQMHHLFKTYFDILSRLEVKIPITIGVILSLISLHSAIHNEVRIIALLELAGWVLIYSLYRRNRAQYIVHGHGPVPVNTWISPPASVLKPGDLILTSGRVAANLRESVGHAELVLEMPDHSMKAFSSYMKYGIVINPLDRVAGAVLKQGHYIVLRLATPFTSEQVVQSAAVAKEMRKENIAWRHLVNTRIKKFLNFLPLNPLLRLRIYRRVRQTGYDYVGLFMGRLTADHWTCIGAILELYHRLAIRTKPYGTGLLGLGSTILDPIMPVRFLDDPAFRLLTNKDKEDMVCMSNQGGNKID